MLLMLIAATAAPAEPETVRDAVEAEYAFAADARRLGQWTAFRKWSGFAAVMFTPKATNAWQWLRGKADPPRSVEWRPAVSYQSCDAKTAINVGPWERPDGSFGYFTTVWIHEDGLKQPRWQWVYDAGDTLKTRMKAGKRPKVRRASCTNIPADDGDWTRYAIPSAPSPDSPEAQSARLHSRDRSLLYDYEVDANGARRFRAWSWNGRRYWLILDQQTAAAQ